VLSLYGDKERAEVQERHESLIRLLFAMGKIRGTPRMRRHSLAHRPTTKFFDKSFLFKNYVAGKGLPKDAPSGLGEGGPRFKSGRPDQPLQQVVVVHFIAHRAVSEIAEIRALFHRFRRKSRLRVEAP
jgi:hypothetical protein